MRTLLLMGVLLTGCGPVPATWKVDCLQIEVPSDLMEAGYVINPGNMQNSATLAKGLFDGRYGEGEFCKRAETVTIKMMEHWWECWGSPTGCQGEFLPLERRVKVITGSALLHEFIHVEETFLHIDGTIKHQGWDTDGQYFLAEEYERATKPWWN